jgi:anti-sigma regulatory factor (Ser/Thr protein kinase)
MRVPPDARHGGYVREQVTAFARNYGIADDEMFDFVAAIGEALANAVEHACSREPIDIHAWLPLNHRLCVSVRDKGVGFAASERALDGTWPDACAERGRGLPIMHRYTNLVHVRSAPGHGTRVTLCHDAHRMAAA